MEAEKIMYKVVINGADPTYYDEKDFEKYGKAVEYVRKSMRKALGKNFRKKVEFVDACVKLYKSKDGRYMWTIYEIVTTRHIRSLIFNI